MTPRQARRLNRHRNRLLRWAKRTDDAFAEKLRESADDIERQMQAGGIPIGDEAALAGGKRWWAVR